MYDYELLFLKVDDIDYENEYEIEDDIGFDEAEAKIALCEYVSAELRSDFEADDEEAEGIITDSEIMHFW